MSWTACATSTARLSRSARRCASVDAAFRSWTLPFRMPVAMSLGLIDACTPIAEVEVKVSVCGKTRELGFE